MSDLMSLWTADRWPVVPREIDVPEESLVESLEAAAAMWPDRVAADFMGEEVVAAIVLEAGQAVLELKAVRDWCSAKVAKYALPGWIVFLPDLPRSQIGKVPRRVVRSDLLATAA